MYKQYLKQAWNLIRQERLFSLFYIVGTGLSVSMVMVLSIVFYLKIANLYPETNRDRMLHVSSGKVLFPENGGQRSWGLSLGMLQTCFSDLKGMEALAIVLKEKATCRIQQADHKGELPVEAKFVNRDFWTVFPFHFLQGQLFTEGDEQSGLPVAVLSESLARRLFGEEDAVGRYFSMNFHPYRVCGVVKDASQVTPVSYAQLWIPYTAYPGYADIQPIEETHSLGRYSACLLAEQGTSLDALKAEAEESVRRYNQTLGGYSLTLLGQPDKQWQSNFRFYSSHAPDYAQVAVQYSALFLLLLLVPAVSLSGMADSRMERRLAELGVRRAFGAPAAGLMQQIVVENFLFTALGGLLGLGLSFVLLFCTRSWVLQLDSVLSGGFMNLPAEGTDIVFSSAMLLNLPVFGAALLVCFLLNLASALLPAWRAAHREIIASLYNHK